MDLCQVTKIGAHTTLSRRMSNLNMPMMNDKDDEIYNIKDQRNLIGTQINFQSSEGNSEVVESTCLDVFLKCFVSESFGNCSLSVELFDDSDIVKYKYGRNSDDPRKTLAIG